MGWGIFKGDDEKERILGFFLQEFHSLLAGGDDVTGAVSWMVIERVFLHRFDVIFSDQISAIAGVLEHGENGENIGSQLLIVFAVGVSVLPVRVR